MSSARCPCGSGGLYEACCGPYHAGEAEAPTPEALMRSRYAAFALGRFAYLVRTLHPDHDDGRRDPVELERELAKGADKRRYRGLKILETRDADADGVSCVRFAVTMSVAGRDASFVELSRFVHDGVGYRYLFGSID